MPGFQTRYRFDHCTNGNSEIAARDKTHAIYGNFLRPGLHQSFQRLLTIACCHPVSKQKMTKLMPGHKCELLLVE